MAIQNRRGDYADLDPSKAVPGEFLIVRNNDPKANDGRAAYIAFEPGKIKRLSTWEDMQEATEEATEEAEAWAKGTRNGNPVSSQDETYHNNSKYFALQSADYATQSSQSAEAASASASEAASWSKYPPYIGGNGNWYVWSLTQKQYVDSGIDASITITIADITMIGSGDNPYVTNTGTTTDPVFHFFLPIGHEISSITKTGTQGLVDTYTITLDNGATFQFTVTNGKTAYQSAVEGGYQGSEADFNQDLANLNASATAAAQSAQQAAASEQSASQSAVNANSAKEDAAESARKAAKSAEESENPLFIDSDGDLSIDYEKLREEN